MPETNPDKWLSVSQVSQLLHVNPETVRRWLRSGQLVGLPLGGRSGYRIERAALDDFIRRRINAELSVLDQSRDSEGDK